MPETEDQFAEFFPAPQPAPATEDPFGELFPPAAPSDIDQAFTPVELLDPSRDQEPKGSMLSLVFGSLGMAPKMIDEAQKHVFGDEPSMSEEGLARMDTVKQYSQAAIESIANAAPFGDTQVAQTFDVAGQIPSALLEQLGQVRGEDSFANQLARTIRDSTRMSDEVLTNQNTFDEFTHAIMQTGAFFGGGKLASNLVGQGTKAAAGIAAWLGAAVGGQAGREDAKRFGAEDWQQDAAYYWNSAFGLSEGLPIGMALGRLDDITGGFITRRIKSGIGQTIAGGTLSALEEALQEGFQTWGENYTARDLAEYDPTRSLTENIGHAAGIGGSVGMLMGLLASGMGVKNRAERIKRANEYTQETYGVDAIDVLGPATPLEEGYLQLMGNINRQQGIIDERSETNTTLQSAAADKVAMVEAHSGESLPRLQVNASEARSLEEQSRGNTPPRRVDIINDMQLSEVEDAPEGTTVIERLDQTPVVSAMSYENKANETILARLDTKITQIEANENATAEEIEALPQLKEHKTALEARNRAEVEMSKSLKELYEKLLPLLGESNNRILLDNSFGSNTQANTIARFRAGFWNAHALGPNSHLTSLIYLSTKQYMSAVGEYTLNNTPGNEAIVKREKSNLITAALHEFGHALGFSRIQGLYTKIALDIATEQEKKIFNGIRNDYHEWLIQNLTRPFLEAMPNVLAASRAMDWIEGRAGLQDNSTETALRMMMTGGNGYTNMQGTFVDRYDVNYLFSFTEFLAEQFAIVSTMETETKKLIGQDKFYADILKEWGVVQRTAKGVFRSGTPTLKALVKQTHLQGQLTEAQSRMKKYEAKPEQALAKAGILSQDVADRISGETDNFNRFYDIGLNIYQIAERNPNLQGLQNYLRHLEEWKNEVNNNLAVAEETLKDWKNLSAKENEQLARSLLDESVGRLPDGGWLANPRALTTEELAKYNLSDEALAIRAKIKADLLAGLNEMETVLVAAKARIFAADALLQGQEIAKVRKEFKDMRARPYFPLMRFGDYVMQVRARGDQRLDGRDYKDGQLVDFQTADTKADRDRLRGVAAKHYPPDRVNISVSHKTLPNFSLQGMPMTLIEHLESKLTSSTITPEIAKAIQELKNDALPFKSFRKQFQRRKRTEGYSLDAQRAYANYMTSYSNHIARVKFDPLFKQDFDMIQETINAINRTDGGDSTKRAKILNHMTEHMDYVMNPVNEFVMIRSAAFVWFLGYNIKSAFVNMSQIPLLTYPYLASRFNDAQAVVELGRAGKTLMQLYTHPDNVSEEIKALVEKGLSESWLDESLATELAMAASEKNLGATLPRKMRQKAWLKISHYGSLPFHLVEKGNRHITAIAAYRLSRAEGKGVEQSQKAARHAVQKTQFEYARYARPRFMRGKVGGTVFVFQNFMQNALWFMLGGDQGALRALTMLFLLAGLQGMPFGENIMDLVDAMMSFLKKKGGVEDPHTAVREDLRELIKEYDVNPDLILHGLSSSTFGLANVGEYMGWPIPSIDLSGSLSMGRIVPGTELTAPGQADTFERAASQTIERAGGAIFSAGAGIGQALFNEHPDQWKRWEKALPAALRNVSKAARMAVRGEEATRGGVQIAEFDMHDIRDQMAIAAQAAGFTPRRVSKGWEGYIAQQQSVIYYKSWSDNLLRAWNYANELNDQEAVKTANAAIRKYNNQVPFGEMRIGSETRRNSYESYIRNKRLNAAGVEQNKRFRRLSDSTQAVFEDADSEGT